MEHSSHEIEDYVSSCLCGRSFNQSSALAKHKRTCQKTKRRLSTALGKAKQVWAEKKRRRLDTTDTQPEAQPSCGLICEPLPEPVQVSHYSVANKVRFSQLSFNL